MQKSQAEHRHKEILQKISQAAQDLPNAQEQQIAMKEAIQTMDAKLCQQESEIESMKLRIAKKRAEEEKIATETVKAARKLETLQCKVSEVIVSFFHMVAINFSYVS